MKKYIAIVVFLGILIFICLVFIVVFYRPRYESDHPLTISEAKSHLRIELPDMATEIFILDQYIGPGHFRYLVRFKINASEGIAWARIQGISREENFSGISSIQNSDYPLWFDLHSIQKGLYFSNSGPPFKEIWVDEIRGLVFYSEAD